MRILIAGCGDIASALGVELAIAGYEIWGLRRDPAGLPAAIRPLRADLTRPATLVGLPRAIDVVVYTAAPDESTDRAYRATYVEGLCALLQALVAQRQGPPRIVFTSSTAVYGQTDGSWVDEASPTEPGDFRGRRLLQAERVLTTGSTATTASAHSVTSSSSPDQHRSTSPSTTSRPTSARCSGGWPVRSAYRTRPSVPEPSGPAHGTISSVFCGETCTLSVSA